MGGGPDVSGLNSAGRPRTEAFADWSFQSEFRLEQPPALVHSLFEFDIQPALCDLRKFMNHQGHQVHQEVSLDLDRTARSAIDAGLKVHKTLGPGLLESAYEHCLAHELLSRGLAVRRQVPMPIIYDNVVLDAGYRLDLLVNEQVIIEIKSVDQLGVLHEAQVLTYLKLSKLRLGLLINFNVPLFKHGVRRLAL